MNDNNAMGGSVAVSDAETDCQEPQDANETVTHNMPQQQDYPYASDSDAVPQGEFRSVPEAPTGRNNVVHVGGPSYDENWMAPASSAVGYHPMLPPPHPSAAAMFPPPPQFAGAGAGAAPPPPPSVAAAAAAAAAAATTTTTTTTTVAAALGQPPPPPPPPPPPQQQQMLQFYEAQMRDHAAAYAGAAWAAAQIAVDMAHASTATASSSSSSFPRTLPPVPPPLFSIPNPMGPYYSAGPQHHSPFMESNMGTGMPGYPGMDGPYPNPYPPMMDEPSYPISGGLPVGLDEEGGSNDASDSYYYYHYYYSGQRRRKRQQRMPPSDAGGATRRGPPSSSLQHHHYHDHHQQQQASEKRGRRRRFRTDGGSSDNNGSSDAQQQQQQPTSSSSSHNHNPNRRARIRKNLASPNHSSDSGTLNYHHHQHQHQYHHPFNKKKKARQPNDESLLGKTGISALYEWATKRRTTPIFTLQPSSNSSSTTTTTGTGTGTPHDATDSITAVMSSTVPSGADSESAPEDEKQRYRGGDEFEMTVSIDGMEWGRGRARTKTAAKQDAARRALQALLPGVAFEEASGILVQLPNTGRTTNPPSTTTTNDDPAAPWKASASLEDLAPNLAKRLAIGQGEDDENPPTQGTTTVRNEDRNDSSKKRPSKWHGVYPCTSTTTSDDDDENAYYESRGASVCSALLHAMVQIDDRIPEAPNYAYEVATVSAGTDDDDDDDEEEEDDDDDDDGDGSPSHLKRKAAENGGDSLSASSRTPFRVHRGPFTCTATMRLRRTPEKGESSPQTTKAYDLLKAEGLGGSKREARHTASAKLLALLFPECEGMVQVKEAAEAARERYAASKALKQQSKRERAFMSKASRWNQSNEHASNTMIFAVGSKEPKLPEAVEEHLLGGLGFDHKRSRNDDARPDVSAATARQLSRHKQLDERITIALQKLNEHDDEGRSLPDEPTVDDVVGRTVLRRGTPEDLHWISMLLDGPAKFPLSPVSVLGPPSPSSNAEQEDTSDELVAAALSMWSPSTIVLLLCRAIAPYEDPPLGCAVLTLGFSMVKGRLLRVAQIGSKPHLPQERFIECLQSFANSMKCSLETKESEPIKPNATIRLRQPEIQSILKSHFSAADSLDWDATLPRFLSPVSTSSSSSSATGRTPLRQESSLVAAALQSVQEESEGLDESGAESGPEKRNAKKEQDKPSKRSRVQ